MRAPALRVTAALAAVLLLALGAQALTASCPPGTDVDFVTICNGQRIPQCFAQCPAGQSRAPGSTDCYQDNACPT